MTRSTSSPRLDTSIRDLATVQKARRLMAALNVGNADLYRGALDVFDWCVRQGRQGRHIMATGDSGHAPVELVTPLLEAAREHGRMVLDAEAFDEVVRVLDRPAEPTNALRDLMAEVYAK